MLADQPFWAARVHRLGLGPAPLTGRLSVDRLTAALAATADPDLWRRCQDLGEALRAEDGVAAATDRLTRVAERSRAP
jgi:sterol 3beta-glucosyltransferase